MSKRPAKKDVFGYGKIIFVYLRNPNSVSQLSGKAFFHADMNDQTVHFWRLAVATDERCRAEDYYTTPVYITEYPPITNIVTGTRGLFLHKRCFNWTNRSQIPDNGPLFCRSKSQWQSWRTFLESSLCLAQKVGEPCSEPEATTKCCPMQPRIIRFSGCDSDCAWVEQMMLSRKN